MMRTTLLVSLVLCVGVSALDGQVVCYRSSVVGYQSSVGCSDNRQPITDNRQLTTATFQETQRGSLLRTTVHYGKWLTAAAAVGFSVMANNQHKFSRRDWDALLAICRSAQDACVVGPDGKYTRADAEALYERSRHYDKMANQALVAAQLSLVATTALFIIDLNPGDGPDNIPYPSQMRVGASLRF
jgi:hypothetical protein